MVRKQDFLIVEVQSFPHPLLEVIIRVFWCSFRWAKAKPIQEVMGHRIKALLCITGVWFPLMLSFPFEIMYLCLCWLSLVERSHKPPSRCWIEELIVLPAPGCFPWQGGSLGALRGVGVTGPLGPACVVSGWGLRPPLQSLLTVWESGPGGAVSSVELWCQSGGEGRAQDHRVRVRVSARVLLKRNEPSLCAVWWALAGCSSCVCHTAIVTQVQTGARSQFFRSLGRTLFTSSHSKQLRYKHVCAANCFRRTDAVNHSLRAGQICLDSDSE